MYNVIVTSSLLINMPFTYEEKCSIKLVRQEKELVQNVFVKNFQTSSVKDLLHKSYKTNLIERKAGSGRPWTVRTEQNIIECVAELICSQEGNPGSSKSPREIEHLTGISHSSIWRITKCDLQL